MWANLLWGEGYICAFLIASFSGVCFVFPKAGTGNCLLFPAVFLSVVAIEIFLDIITWSTVRPSASPASLLLSDAQRVLNYEDACSLLLCSYMAFPSNILL